MVHVPSWPQRQLHQLVFAVVLYHRWAPVHPKPPGDDRPSFQPSKLGVINTIEPLSCRAFLQDKPPVARKVEIVSKCYKCNGPGALGNSCCRVRHENRRRHLCFTLEEGFIRPHETKNSAQLSTSASISPKPPYLQEKQATFQACAAQLHGQPRDRASSYPRLLPSPRSKMAS